MRQTSEVKQIIIGASWSEDVIDIVPPVINLEKFLFARNVLIEFSNQIGLNLYKGDKFLPSDEASNILMEMVEDAYVCFKHKCQNEIEDFLTPDLLSKWGSEIGILLASTYINKIKNNVAPPEIYLKSNLFKLPFIGKFAEVIVGCGFKITAFKEMLAKYFPSLFNQYKTKDKIIYDINEGLVTLDDLTHILDHSIGGYYVRLKIAESNAMNFTERDHLLLSKFNGKELEKSLNEWIEFKSRKFTDYNTVSHYQDYIDQTKEIYSKLVMSYYDSHNEANRKSYVEMLTNKRALKSNNLSTNVIVEV